MDVQCRDRSFYLGLLKKAAVQTGYIATTFPAQSIHLREKNIAGPTERSRRGGKPLLRKLAGKDLRFSMKMMFAPDPGASIQPV